LLFVLVSIYILYSHILSETIRTTFVNISNIYRKILELNKNSNPSIWQRNGENVTDLAKTCGGVVKNN